MKTDDLYKNWEEYKARIIQKLAELMKDDLISEEKKAELLEILQINPPPVAPKGDA